MIKNPFNLRVLPFKQGKTTKRNQLFIESKVVLNNKLLQQKITNISFQLNNHLQNKEKWIHVYNNRFLLEFKWKRILLFFIHLQILISKMRKRSKSAQSSKQLIQILLTNKKKNNSYLKTSQNLMNIKSLNSISLKGTIKISSNVTIKHVSYTIKNFLLTLEFILSSIARTVKWRIDLVFMNVQRKCVLLMNDWFTSIIFALSKKIFATILFEFSDCWQ